MPEIPNGDAGPTDPLAEAPDEIASDDSPPGVATPDDPAPDDPAPEEANPPGRLEKLRAFFRRLGRRLLWTCLVLLIGLAAWGAHDLDRLVRAARHDGGTWKDLEKGVDRFTDADAEEAGTAPEVVAEQAESLEDLAVVALRLRELQVPVRGVEPDDLYDSFGDSRSGGRQHRAIDIAAPAGTPVLAAVDGPIASKDTGRLGGKYLFQSDDTESFVFYYAHLDGYAWGLSEGDRVRRGDVLGYVGTTGNAPVNAPHLHFAIYKTVPGRRGPGVPVNPFAVFRLQ